jgi:acyl-CoA synthetase (AMP-forming)/AMP-acid ligase II
VAVELQSNHFVDRLLRATHLTPDAPALFAGSAVLTYAQLDERVHALAAEFDLPQRSVVVLNGERTVGFVVAYLAAQRAGHVPLLAAREHMDALAASWAAAAVAHIDGDEVDVQRLAAPATELHPQLALLLSTSGSTGSPKLVRLSHTNLSANAEAIIEYLGITAADRAITTLPMHYCYGLSVLHSHLAAGASVVIADGSVVDPCTLAAIDRHGVTSLAGVPHTFALLDRSGFDPAQHPSLRMLTQAGGKMSPECVARWAAKANAAGVDLFVMYGQTEATARMAFLPPAAIATHPGSIGRPIPGGSFALMPHPVASGSDEGELVYTGPNVMMGYAEALADLAAPATVTSLRTGDLARFDPDSGLYELTGRISRIIKPFGQRIDLDRVEAMLGERGLQALATGDDDRLVVAVVARDGAAVRSAVADIAGLPHSAVIVHPVSELPRLANGKPDHCAVRAMRVTEPVTVDTDVASVFRTVLGRDRLQPNDTFVSLGGDSLSYVECSLRLEELALDLPNDWHVRPLAELVAAQPASGMPRIDTTIVIRAVGICAIIATHMGLWRVPGGAHTLLAVIGYNFARFQLSLDGARERVTAGLRTAARVAVPTSIWIGLNMLIAGGYSLGALALVNGYTGSSFRTDGRWRYWFFESFVQLIVIATVLMAIPAVARLERRTPYAFALALLAPLLLLRFEIVQFGDPYNYLYRTHTVAWCFVLGWLIFRARSTAAKVVTSLLILAVVPGFFDQWYRESFIVVALLALLWLPTLPMPRALQRPIRVIAAASMWIFLVHWQLFPVFDRPFVREFAYVLTLAAGVVVWWLVTRLHRSIRSTVSPKGIPL